MRCRTTHSRYGQPQHFHLHSSVDNAHTCECKSFGFLRIFCRIYNSDKLSPSSFLTSKSHQRAVMTRWNRNMKPKPGHCLVFEFQIKSPRAGKINLLRHAPHKSACPNLLEMPSQCAHVLCHKQTGQRQQIMEVFSSGTKSGGPQRHEHRWWSSCQWWTSAPTLTTRIRFPIAAGGRFLLNFALTEPLFPCGRVTLPQMTRSLLGLTWPGQVVLLQGNKNVMRLNGWIQEQTRRRLSDSVPQAYKFCHHGQNRYTFPCEVDRNPQPLEQNKSLKQKYLYLSDLCK